MNSRARALLVGGLFGVVVPLTALTLGAGADHGALGLLPPPFGWTRLAVVHLLAGLPLALLLAGGLLQMVKRPAGSSSFLTALLEELGDIPGFSPRSAWVWAIPGLIVAGLTYLNGGKLADWLELRDAGFTSGLALRCGWCLLLQLPWCLLGQSLASGSPPNVLPGLSRGPAVLLAALVAAALPAIYAQDLIENQSQKAEEWLRGHRLLRALTLVQGLCDVGSTRPIDGKPPREALDPLRSQVEDYTASVQGSLPGNAPTTLKVLRAEMLAALGRYAETEQQLADVADTNLPAILLRAAVAQDQKHWEESTRQYRRALELLAKGPPDAPATMAARTRAYNGLAFNARERNAYREAENWYREGMEQVPAQAAYFHFQLGKLFQVEGKSAEAVEQWETAARLDSSFTEPTRMLLVGLHGHTPGCSVGGRRP